MGQSWERPRAGQSQPPQCLRVLGGRTGVTSRPSFPALTQTPCEEASKVSPLSATPGFLRNPQTNHTSPRRLAQLGGGVSQRGSVASHILGLVTQCPTPIPSPLAGDSGHPAACEDSAFVPPPQSAASSFPGASGSPAHQPWDPEPVTWQGGGRAGEGGLAPSPSPRCQPAGSGTGVALGRRVPAPGGLAPAPQPGPLTAFLDFFLVERAFLAFSITA